MHVLLFSFSTFLGLSLLLFSLVIAVVSLQLVARLVLFCRNPFNFNTLVIQCNHSEKIFLCWKKQCFTFFPSLHSGEDWNQMQSQEDDVAITEQDLELIKERETAIRQLEVKSRSCTYVNI